MSAPFCAATLPLDLPRQPRPKRIGRARRTARTQARRAGQINGVTCPAQWPLEGDINVVLFAGMGGACQGLEDAGFPIHVAVNHNASAIAAHQALNPHTRHLHADIYEVCPLKATQGKTVGLLWASPDCRDHSNAKGGAPRSPRVRSMPWQVCRWVGVLRKRGLGPRHVAFLENVREIRQWGPLIAKRDKQTGRVIKLDGSVAAKGERVPVREQMLIRNPKKLGRTYRAWCKHMRGLGADYTDRDLDFSEYGVPTSRKRLFGAALFTGRPMVWPEVTHGHRDSDAVKCGRLLPAVPAARIIDWSLEIPSIFDRKKPLVHNTLARLAFGMKRYVIESPEPYLVHLTHHGSRPAIGMQDSLPTITGAHRGEIALVAPTIVPTSHSASTERCHTGASPMPALTAGVKRGELQVMAAYVAEHRGCSVDQAANQSLGDQTAIPRHGVVAAHVTEFRTRSIGQDIGDPAVTATGTAHHGLIAAHLTKFREGAVGGDIRESLPTVTANGHTEGKKPGCGIPIGVVGAQLAPAAAWLLQQNYLEPGHHPLDSLSTIVQKAGPQAVGAAYLTHLRGTGTALDAGDALPAQTTGGGRGGAHVGISAATFAEPPLTAAQYRRARQVADFLRSHGVWAGGDLVVVGNYIVIDIGMRMLTPAEAAAAHELRLPERIKVPKLDRKKNVVRDADGRPVMIERPLTKTEAMSLVGNSVPKRLPYLLAKLNVPHTLAAAA